MTDLEDLPKTTMHTVARMLYNIDPGSLDRRFEELDDQEWNAWHMKAVAIINAAEPVWRSRIGVEYEYGIRVELSEEAHGPGTFIEQPIARESLARQYAEDSPNVTVIRRIKTEWEAV